MRGEGKGLEVSTKQQYGNEAIPSPVLSLATVVDHPLSIPEAHPHHAGKGGRDKRRHFKRKKLVTTPSLRMAGIENKNSGNTKLKAGGRSAERKLEMVFYATTQNSIRGIT